MSDYTTCQWDGVNDLYTEAGIASIYANAAGGTPAGASGTPVVIVEHNLASYGDDIGVYGKNAIIRVRTTEVANVPEYRDTFTVTDPVTEASKEWMVEEPVFSNQFEIGVLVA